MFYLLGHWRQQQFSDRKNLLEKMKDKKFLLHYSRELFLIVIQGEKKSDSSDVKGIKSKKGDIKTHEKIEKMPGFVFLTQFLFLG